MTLTNGEIRITRVPPGPFAVGINGPMFVDIRRDSTPTAPDGSFALVGYFHTHPYYEGQPINGDPDVYGSPDLASVGDQITADALKIPGLIAYRDKTGKRKNVAFGPARGDYCY